MTDSRQWRMNAGRLPRGVILGSPQITVRNRVERGKCGFGWRNQSANVELGKIWFWLMGRQMLVTQWQMLDIRNLCLFQLSSNNCPCSLSCTCHQYAPFDSGKMLAGWEMINSGQSFNGPTTDNTGWRGQWWGRPSYEFHLSAGSQGTE